MGKWTLDSKRSCTGPYDIPTAGKRRFWREIEQLVNTKESRFDHELDSELHGLPSITARHPLDRCVVVKVRDDKSVYYYKESGGQLRDITKDRAKSLLTRDLDCKLLCEYIQTRYQSTEKWRLRLVIFLDDVHSPNPRYFVEFTEFCDDGSPRNVREVSAKVDIQVDTCGPFGLRWKLTIIRENGQDVSFPAKT